MASILQVRGIGNAEPGCSEPRAGAYGGYGRGVSLFNPFQVKSTSTLMIASRL